MSNKEEIKGRKPNRLYAPFFSKKHMFQSRDDIFKKMPKRYQNELMLFLGQLESTQAEGFSDDYKEKEQNNENN